jgi:repressor LexA
MDAKPLRDVQHRVLAAIQSYMEENDCPPTLREIQDMAHLSSTSHVDYHLEALESKGYIRRTPGMSRGIEVIADGAARRRAHLVNVPIQGMIAAGEPIQAVPLPEDLFLTRDVARVGDYALRVRGSSMIEDHIENGDIVIVHHQDTAYDGDTVVALLMNGAGDTSGEATLKRFYREPAPEGGGRGRIRLEPRNQTMHPIYCEPEQVQIQGKVVGVLRRLP